MREVFAGWAAGYVMGILATLALAYLARSGGTLSRVKERVLPGLPAPAFAVPVFVGSSLAWTMVGLALGSLYRVGDFAARRDGLGSPSLAFTSAVVLVAVIPVPFLVLFARRDWPVWAGLAVSFAALFGWGVPLASGG